MKLLASLQAGRGLGKSPGALHLPLSNAHRAVVGQHSRGAVPHQASILPQHLGTEPGAQHCVPAPAQVWHSCLPVAVWQDLRAAQLHA